MEINANQLIYSDTDKNVLQFLIHLQHGNKSQEHCMTSRHGQGCFLST